MTTDVHASDRRTADPDLRPAVSAELLGVKAVAALLGGCSLRHIFRLADSGRLPRPVKLGALVRWRRAELMRWIEDGCPPIPSTKLTAQ